MSLIVLNWVAMVFSIVVAIDVDHLVLKYINVLLAILNLIVILKHYKLV
jgi:hypothetical protein